MSEQPDLSSKRSLRDLQREAGLPLNGDDLLIRSVSTILRWMQHSPEAPTNRLALTLVSGTRPADVAAVIYWDKAHSRLLVDTIPGEHGFDVVKNSPLLESAEPEPFSDDVDPTLSLENDMYKFFYKRGVDAISVEMHASRMEALLNDVHNVRNSQQDTKTARQKLRHYIYMYCTCKIWQHITARAPRFGHQILHFFLGKNGKDLLLNEEDFDVASRIPSASRLLDQDETWLREQLCGFDQTGTVEFKLEEVDVQNSKAVHHLLLNKEVLWSLYRFAAGCIHRLHQATFGIRTWIKSPQPGQNLSSKDRQRMEAMLDEMHSAFYRLYNLLYRSPSFWRLVDLLRVISIEKLQELEKQDGVDAKRPANEPKQSESSSSANAYASSTDSPFSPTDITTRRNAVKHPDQSYTRLADDPFAEEVGLNTIHTFSDVVRGWLQFVTRWYHAVQDLCDGETVRAAVQHGFVISATTAALPQLPHRQRSLVSTLWSLQQPKKWTVEQARDAIKAKATELVQAMKPQTREEATATDAQPARGAPSTIHDRQLKALRILADFSEETIQQWEEAFEGCVHCEADLACRMYLEDRDICEDLIGVSKRCCFCCDSALLAFYPHFNGVSSHGTVWHWAPPPETPEFVKEAVIFDLKVEFDRFVRRYLHPNEADESRPLTSDSS
ncbi:hypothetical protein FRC01_012079 [Tulasnella sp. 417]|nr:hypothetical protein FRC01_012079 [Tulasnella sp. 417]